MENLPNGNSANDNVAANNITNNSKEFDFEFLSLFYEVIKRWVKVVQHGDRNPLSVLLLLEIWIYCFSSIEKDPTAPDSSGKGRDNQDVSSKVLDLEKKLNEARQQVNGYLYISKKN